MRRSRFAKAIEPSSTGREKASVREALGFDLQAPESSDELSLSEWRVASLDHVYGDGALGGDGRGEQAAEEEEDRQTEPGGEELLDSHGWLYALAGSPGCGAKFTFGAVSRGASLGSARPPS